MSAVSSFLLTVKATNHSLEIEVWQYESSTLCSKPRGPTQLAVRMFQT